VDKPRYQEGAACHRAATALAVSTGRNIK
jgi:hypothetical protein